MKLGAGSVLILHIRQAEMALKDGRLDEAFELARTDAVRAHRRGQELIGRLVRALVARGREHLSAGRLAQASADCGKAGQLGGNLPEAAGLEAAIGEAMRARQQADRARADAVAAAREHVENGRLSMGQRLLADVETDSGRVQALREEVTARRVRVEAALARARSALERDEWGLVVEALVEARAVHASNRELTALIARVVELVVGRAGDAIDEGRLDLAASMMQRLAPLASSSIARQEVERIIEGCRSAGRCLERGELRAGAEILRRLASMRPGAGWLGDAVGGVDRAAESLEHVRGGPLGLLSAGPPVPAGRGPLAETHVIPGGNEVGRGGQGVGAALPRRFTIQVDGVGSFLVLRDRRVGIGPVSSSRRPEVGLLADAGLPTATIERTDEDYFVSCDTAVSVNDAPVTRKLLASGDRIALSARCRMKFVLPHAASTSAVIDLTSARLPRGDARRVILLDKSMVVGPGTSAHIRADELVEPAVLHVRDGRLSVQSKVEVTVNDRPMDRQVGIPMNAQVKIGSLSMVITEA